jgi:hypothetical protein
MPSNSEIANSAIQNAIHELRLGNKQAARSLAMRAITLAPETEDPWLILAVLAEPDASLHYLKEALKINPASQRARQGLLEVQKRLEMVSSRQPNVPVAQNQVANRVDAPVAGPEAAPTSQALEHEQADEESISQEATPVEQQAVEELGRPETAAPEVPPTSQGPVIAQADEETASLETAPIDPAPIEDQAVQEASSYEIHPTDAEPIDDPVSPGKPGMETSPAWQEPDYYPAVPEIGGLEDLPQASKAEPARKRWRWPKLFGLILLAGGFVLSLTLVLFRHGSAQAHSLFVNDQNTANSFALAQQTLTPAIPSDTPMIVSPTPPVPLEAGDQKRIIVSLSLQRLYAYQGERLVYSFIVSTGSDENTRPGTFSVLDKLPKPVSNSWGFWMPDWIGFEDRDGLEIGIHALPVTEEGEVLWADMIGSPGEHACVILRSEDAHLLYDWADVGIQVDIIE